MTEATSTLGAHHPRSGRPEAARAIWKWRHGEGESASDAAPRPVRLHGSIQAGVGAAIGGFFTRIGRKKQ